ncbi:MAG: primosomal protein N' family DNA-binding protein [Acidimicrobiales bacterium]
MRVVPDVDALRKPFDYVVPPELADAVTVGTSVRVVLHNRRVAGWVVEDGVEPPAGVQLRPLLAVRGIGPPADVVALARWAAWRWAGPWSRLLGTASSPTLVRGLPARPAGPALDGSPSAGVAPVDESPAGKLAGQALAGGTRVVRLAPGHDPLTLLDAAARLVDAGRDGGGEGGVLVLAPSHDEATVVAARLRRLGHRVALLPGQWAVARAGGCVAVGTRAGAWAPLPRLLGAVVLDAHDEVYHEERAPTWAAWAVVAERARRQGVPCALVSPCPTLELLEAGPLVEGSRAEDRAGWPVVEVVDRRRDDPRSGLYSSRLVEFVRSAAHGGGRVLCVLNRTGRARLLACAACGELARCTRCGGPMEKPGGASDDELRCRRCRTSRPALCAACGSTRLKTLRAGVSRVREEIEALAGVPVAEVTAVSSDGDATRAPVVVGTEAVLHRAGRADAVAFLDFDAELLAPRFRAGEEALALLTLAARSVTASSGATSGRPGGRVLVQTRLPDHVVLAAAVGADAGRLAQAERELRRELGLPPFSAMALVSGAAADDYAHALAAQAAAAGSSVQVSGPVDGTWTVRGPDHQAVCDLLAAVERPSGRLRVEVDPVRA